MIRFTINGAEVDRIAHGTRVMVCTETLTAIDVLRDDLAEHAEISRENATKMIIESLQETLSIKE